MFARNDIIQFISRIIINVKEKKEARENILKFRRYLELTQMADAKTLEKIDKIVLCLDSILQIKQVMDEYTYKNNKKNTIPRIKNTTNKISSMPTLESMIEDKPITNNIEQSEVIKSIETNIQKNKELNTTFKNRVYEEVKKELIDKGYVE